MPKPHISDAPQHIKEHFERWRLETTLRLEDGSTVYVQALGFLNAMTFAFARGYDVRPEDVPTPATDRVTRFEGTALQLQTLKRTLAYELAEEKRCVEIARNRRGWAAAPAESEIATERRLEREKAAADAALEQRTAEIVNAAETERLEKLKAAARKQATKELNHGQ